MRNLISQKIVDSLAASDLPPAITAHAATAWLLDDTLI
jgi:hypothetical protein